MTLLRAAQVVLRRMHSSLRTEEAHLLWIRESIRFHQKRHPRPSCTMGAPEITAFLNHLATQRRVSASTQNQALSAIVFLYKRVLDMDMPELSGIEPARRPMPLPAVLSRREVLALIEKLEPPFRLMGEIFYSAGLRLMECVSLRVKDVDTERHQVTVRRGKGNRDREATASANIVRRPEPPSTTPAHKSTTLTNLYRSAREIWTPPRSPSYLCHSRMRDTGASNGNNEEAGKHAREHDAHTSRARRSTLATITSTTLDRSAESIAGRIDAHKAHHAPREIFPCLATARPRLPLKS